MWRDVIISATVSTFLLLFILPITVRIIVFTVVLTAIIIFTAKS